MTWFDQGLWFTLIFSSALTAASLITYIFLSTRKSISLLRLLRPNNLSLPDPPNFLTPVKEVIVLGKPILLKLICFRRLFQVGEIVEESKQFDMEAARAGGSEDSYHDPMVLMTLFIFKVLAIIFLSSFFSVLWATPLFATDDYLARNGTKDLYNCRQEHFEKSCTDRHECYWINATSTCSPKPIHGLADLTIDNITPGSDRLWGVVLLGLAFTVTLSLIVVKASRNATRYVRGVMGLQLRGSLGYRTVMVKGIDPAVAADEEKFRREYLSVRALTFFPKSRSPSLDDEPLTNSKIVKMTRRRFSICFTYFSPIEELALFEELSDDEFQIIKTAKEVSPALKINASIEKSINSYDEALNELNEALSQESYYHSRLKKAPHDDKNLPPLEGRLLPKFWRKVPLVEYYTQRFFNAAERYNNALTDLEQARPTGTIYVVFKDPCCALEYINIFNTLYQRPWSNRYAMLAGPPEEINHCNTSRSKRVGVILSMISVALFLGILLFWSLVVASLSSFKELCSYPTPIGDIFTFIRDNTSDYLLDIIEACLPVLVLALFNFFLPIIVRSIVVLGGSPNKTHTDMRQMNLLFIFFFLNSVLFVLLGQTILYILWRYFVEDTFDISLPEMLLRVVTPRGVGMWFLRVLGPLPFFLLPLFNISGLLKSYLLGWRVQTQKMYDSIYERPSISIHMCLPPALTVMAIGLFFHITLPVVTFLVGIYFMYLYLTTRGLLFELFKPTLPVSEQLTSFEVLRLSFNSLISIHFVSTLATPLLCVAKKASGPGILSIASCIISFISLVLVARETRSWQPDMQLTRSVASSGGGNAPGDSMKKRYAAGCLIRTQINPKDVILEAKRTERKINRWWHNGQIQFDDEMIKQSL